MANEKNLNEGNAHPTPPKKEVGRWENEGGQPRPVENERVQTDQDRNDGVNQGRKNPLRFTQEPSSPRRQEREPTRH